MCNRGCINDSWKCRYLMAFMGFMCVVMSYTMRVGIHVTILSMVNDSTDTAFQNNSEYYCYKFTGVMADKKPRISTGEYDWDRPTQGFILGAFFWGYVITQIPAGLISFKYGPKWVAFFGIFGCALVELCVPVSSHLNPVVLLALRAIEGLFLGVLVPAVGGLLGNWAPPGEKSRFGALIICGMQLGTIIGQILAGIISQPRLIDINTPIPQSLSSSSTSSSVYFSYWPYVHYLFSVLNILYSLLWAGIVYDTPQKHPWISDAEKEYLMQIIYNSADDQSIQAERIGIIENEGEDLKKETQPITDEISFKEGNSLTNIPWKDILKSKAVWSIVICHFTFDWGWFTLVIFMPTYMSRVLGFDLMSNGFLSSLPYIVQICVSFVVAYVSDIFILYNVLSIGWIRRINNFIALGGLAIGIISVGLVGCKAYEAIGVFTLTIGLMGFSAAGFFANSLDISSAYAANIISISNTIAPISGIFAPLVVGYVTRDSSELGNWLIIFGISTGFASLGAVINLFMTSGEMELWGKATSS
ncbi:Sialin [Schistosoma japonicum]|uniref:Sialin n=1 Tax=Schistosoma japonicum TaxID=6182 RepID=A0A4Z2CP54_SCHJA|nr:Sialin [Schistosoma japonicum]TNN05770.1 Sialin [Schistosoma japonicum]